MFSEQNFIIFSCFFIIATFGFFALYYIITKKQLTKTITGINFRLFLVASASIMNAIWIFWFLNYLKTLEQQPSANWLFITPLTLTWFGSLNSGTIFDIWKNRVTNNHTNETLICIYGLIGSFAFLIGLILFAIPIFWP